MTAAEARMAFAVIEEAARLSAADAERLLSGYALGEQLIVIGCASAFYERSAFWQWCLSRCSQRINEATS